MVSRPVQSYGDYFLRRRRASPRAAQFRLEKELQTGVGWSTIHTVAELLKWNHHVVAEGNVEPRVGSTQKSELTTAALSSLPSPSRRVLRPRRGRKPHRAGLGAHPPTLAADEPERPAMEVHHVNGGLDSGVNRTSLEQVRARAIRLMLPLLTLSAWRPGPFSVHPPFRHVQPTEKSLLPYTKAGMRITLKAREEGLEGAGWAEGEGTARGARPATSVTWCQPLPRATSPRRAARKLLLALTCGDLPGPVVLRDKHQARRRQGGTDPPPGARQRLQCAELRGGGACLLQLTPTRVSGTWLLYRADGPLRQRQGANCSRPLTRTRVPPLEARAHTQALLAADHAAGRAGWPQDGGHHDG